MTATDPPPIGNPLSEPMISAHTYGPCGAPGCPRTDARLFPCGRRCETHRPQPAGAR